VSSASLVLLDLASARLWIALRSTEAVDRFWPAWDIATLLVHPELIRETDPDEALISAMRSGVNIGVFGVPEGSDHPEPLPAHAWPYASMFPEAFHGNVGQIGAWRGVTVVARDLRRAFPLRATPLARAATKARIELVTAAMAAEAGTGAVPIGAEWKAMAPSEYGINDFSAFKIWREVAKDHPVLSNPKGKPKRRKAA